MSTSSEAVMVSPEQCATAPKSALTKGFAPAQTSTSSARIVLLAVLALAAASGAMFGVVVFGNEFTKDVHPKGDTYANSVTLVDSNDKAIATADVESYVSLLDMPLLGTAELNKVDGITFSTYKGIEHRKVTGYTIAKETATVGDSSVVTPRLTLRSDPGVTIVVSVRDSKAWVHEVDSIGATTTTIETTSTRRLGDGAGSCLANGACLYSRDELLRVDAETRRLAEGGFFARADVAAYQVDLNGEDILSSITDDARVSYLEGRYADSNDNEMMLRLQQSASSSSLYLKNLTDGSAKLMTNNGTFLFHRDELYRCTQTSSQVRDMLVQLDLDEFKAEKSATYHKITLTHSTKMRDDFIPHSDTTEDDCTAYVVSQTNLSNPAVRQALMPDSGNAQRKLVSEYKRSMSKVANRRAAHEQEMISLMLDPHNERSQLVEARHKHVMGRHLKAQKDGRVYHDGTGWLKTELTELRELGRELGGAGSGSGYRDDDDFYGNYSKSVKNGSGVMSYHDEVDLYNNYAEDFEYEAYVMTFAKPSHMMATYITHFDLWLATRVADPTFINDRNEAFNDQTWASDVLTCRKASDGVNSAAAGGDDCSGLMNPETVLNMAGSGGISRLFKWWSGLMPVGNIFMPWNVIDSLGYYTDSSSTVSIYDDFDSFDWASWPVPSADQLASYLENYGGPGFTPLSITGLSTGISKAFFHVMFPGSCAGGFDAEWAIDLAGLMELGQAAVEDNEFYQEWIGLDLGFPVQYIYDWCMIFAEGDESTIKEWLFDEEDEQYGNLATVIGMMCKQAVLGFIEDEGGNTDYMPTLKVEVPEDDGGSIEMADVPLVYPNSWASYLQKVSSEGTEYIVAFQGTKATDLSMLQYNTRQTPIFTYMGDMPMIIPEGYYDYMAGLAVCMDKMISDLSVLPTFITGHSLGGAAATLYANAHMVEWGAADTLGEDAFAMAAADITSFPRLVTFGAAPTFYQGAGPGMEADAYGTKIKCIMQPGYGAGEMDEWCGFGGEALTELMIRRKMTGNSEEEKLAQRRLSYYYYGADDDEFRVDEEYWAAEGYDVDSLFMLSSAYSTFMTSILGDGASGKSGYCALAYPQSVRFYHKFDPIPSIAMWKGNYAHSVEWAVMVYDKYDSACSIAAGGCPISSVVDSSYEVDDLGFDDADPSVVDEYLCTMFGAQAATWVSSCGDAYSSYMSFLNPFPCGQILFHEHLINFMDGDYYGWDVDKYINGDDTSELSLGTIGKSVFGQSNTGGDIVIYTFPTGTPEKYNIFDLQYVLFHEFETFGKCVADWFATMDLYLVPAIVDMWYSFGAFFTFSYVHSTYGFYPLCTGKFLTAPSGNTIGSGLQRTAVGEEPHSFFVDSVYEAKEFSKSCGSKRAVEQFCGRKLYYEERWCMIEGLELCDVEKLCNCEYEMEIREGNGVFSADMCSRDPSGQGCVCNNVCPFSGGLPMPSPGGNMRSPEKSSGKSSGK
jgi:hypothetical protein